MITHTFLFDISKEIKTNLKQPQRLLNKGPILHIFDNLTTQMPDNCLKTNIAYQIGRTMHINKDFNNDFELKWRRLQDDNDDENDGLLRSRRTD